MTPAVKPLGQVQLGVGLTTIVEAPPQPPNTIVRVTCLIITNTDSVLRKFTLRVGSGILVVGNSHFENTDIAANTTYLLNTSAGYDISLIAGQLLQGLADAAAKINASAYGEVIIG